MPTLANHWTRFWSRGGSAHLGRGTLAERSVAAGGPQGNWGMLGDHSLPAPPCGSFPACRAAIFAAGCAALQCRRGRAFTLSSGGCPPDFFLEAYSERKSFATG